MKKVFSGIAVAAVMLIGLAPAANATFGPPPPPPGICEIIPTFPGCTPNQGGTAEVGAEVEGNGGVAVSTKDISHVTVGFCFEGEIHFTKFDDLDGKSFEFEVDGEVVVVFVKSGQNTTEAAEQLLVSLGGVISGSSTGAVAFFNEEYDCAPPVVQVLVCIDGAVALVDESVAVELELEVLVGDYEVGDTVPCETPTTTTTVPPTTTTTQPPVTTTTTEPPVVTTTTTEPPVTTTTVPEPTVVTPEPTPPAPPAEVPVTNVSNDDELAFGGSWSALLAMIGVALGATGLLFRFISRRIGVQA